MTEPDAAPAVRDGRSRCGWEGTDPLYVAYHDTEWGVPVRDDRRMFEFLVLETFQAGLSWLTILRKRENFRRAFAGFDPEAVAAFDGADVARLLGDAGIVRNRAKIDAAIGNARAYLDLAAEHGSFCDWLWSYVDGTPVVGGWADLASVPATTPLAERIAADLKAHGFRWVGPTVVYAHMQATGMVNDHLVTCFRHDELRT